MKRNSALLIVIAIVLVLSLSLAACNKKDAPPQDEKATYSVSIPSGEGYTVVGAANVKEGEDYSFQVNIANGYNGTDMVVKVNGNTVVKTGNAYVVNSVSGNLVITVTGVKKNAPDTYTVTLPSGNGFTASGETTVTAGSNYTFTVTVATGYDVSTLVVKNVEATLTATSTEGNVVTYTINNVQSNITLTATIAKLKFSVTLPTGEGYAVVGESEAVYGEDYTFTVNAVAGYSVKDAVVKSGDVTLTGVNGTYTVANVTANVVITVENVVKLTDYVSVTTRVYDLKLADITDAQKAAAYYMTGVSGVYQNETCEVSADLSAVDFTRAGTYTITYKLVGHETVTETATVNVYGEPAITVASDAIKTVVWSKNLDLNAFINTLVGKISAVDSLNNALTVNVKAATVPAKNAYGFYDIQSYNVTFTATDKMGNLAEETVQITINGSTAIEVAPTMNVDLANTSVMLAAYEAGVDFDLFKYDSENGLVAITTAQAAWDSDKQGTFFATSYLAGLTLGEHTFVLVFEDTFKVVTLTLTDNQEPAFTTSDVTELAYLVGEEFVLPTAVKSANSAQAITVKYFLGSEEFTANPTAAGSYTYTIKFFRNNEELTEYAKEYSLVLVNNYGWSGANVSATKDGKVALSGVFKEGTAYVDSNPILSAEYISANKGENNIVVVTLRVLDQGTNNSTVEGQDRGIWYVKGVDYITEATHPANSVGVTPKTGDEYTMKLRIEENGTATFILRNFDGKVEVTSVGFEYHKEYVEDPNFTKGYAESVELTYNDEQTRINSAKIVVPAGNDWWTDSPALSATYIKTLYAAGVRYIEIAPTFTTKDGEAFIYQYYDAAQEKNVEFTNLGSGQTVLFALTDEKQIALSKVDTKGGQGKTAADTINVAFTYYTQEEYDAAQAEIAKKEARAKLAATMKSSGGFYNYFKIGAWCDPDTTAWGENNTSVNFKGGNFTIARNLIDDALLAGYTHMKFHLVAVAEDSSKTINEIALLTNPGDTYYWKLYGGTDTDIRIDLTVFAVEGHTSDSLIVRMRDAAFADVSSALTLSAIEFFKSEETTTWTKSASNVYIANENGTLVLDTVCAGNDAFAESDAEWFAKYFGQGNGVSQRTLKVVECATIYNGSNTRNMLYGWDGENKSPLPASGYLNNFTGSTLRLAFDKDGVAQVKFDNVYANRNEWTTQFTHADNTITVSNTCNDYELFFNNLDELKEKYESITFTITDTSALSGIVWFYYNDAALPINSSDNANPKTITLSEATRLMIHFTAVENITITYTLNPKSAN